MTASSATIPGHIRGPEICRRAKITYRQLDYWVRTDLIRPTGRFGGSGSINFYDYSEFQIIVTIKAGLDAGLSLQRMRRIAELIRTFPTAEWVVAFKDDELPLPNLNPLAELVQGEMVVAILHVGPVAEPKP